MSEAEERRNTCAVGRNRIDTRLEGLLRERNHAEEELADAAGRREEATAALYRLRSSTERLELRREAAGALAERLKEAPPPRVGADDERLRTTRERLAAVTQALA